MTEYDLKSLNLPKLYGSMLKVFDAITSSKLTRPLIIGSLVNNGGIPKLRDRVFDEPPTNFPLVLSDEPASAPLEFPQQLSANVFDNLLQYLGKKIDRTQGAQQVNNAAE